MSLKKEFFRLGLMAVIMAGLTSVAFAKDKFELEFEKDQEAVKLVRDTKRGRLAAWKANVFRHWAQVRVESVEARRPGTHRVGDEFALAAVVGLGGLTPHDVRVEAYHGRLDDKQQIAEGRGVALRLEASLDGGRHRFVGVVPCDRSGMQGYTVRVRPSHPDANSIQATGLMTWW